MKLFTISLIVVAACAGLLVLELVRQRPSNSAPMSRNPAGEGTSADVGPQQEAGEPSPSSRLRSRNGLAVPPPSDDDAEREPTRDEKLHLELEELYGTVQATVDAPAGWFAEARDAFQEVQSVLVAKLGSRVTVPELQCHSNGCSAAIRYAGQEDFDAAFKFLDRAEVIQKYPRVITGPLQRADGEVTSHLLLYVKARPN